MHITLTLQGKTDRHHTIPVMLTVIYQGKRYRKILTRITPDQWDHKRGLIRKSHPQSHNLNLMIDTRIQQVRKNILSHETHGTDLDIKLAMEDAHTIAQYIRSRDILSQYTLSDAIRSQIQKYKNTGSYNTAISYESLLSVFHTYGNDPILSHIDRRWIEDYHHWLATERHNKPSSISEVINKLHNALTLAIKDGHIDHNPFKGYKVKSKKTHKPILTIKDINTLASIPISRPRTAMYRDMWIFSFYNRGMRISDVIKLRWQDIHADRIMYVTGKNNKKISIKIIPQTRVILDRYKDTGHHRVFPLLEPDLKPEDITPRIKNITNCINSPLKRLAAQCGITQSISCHTARHSFAAIASRSGVSSYAIQHLLGHSDLNTTERYLQDLFADEHLDSEIDKIFE